MDIILERFRVSRWDRRVLAARRHNASLGREYGYELAVANVDDLAKAANVLKTGVHCTRK